MSETLSQKQRRFTRMIAELIIWAYDNGYELTTGDFFRDPRVHGAMGEKKSYSEGKSAHKQRLAADLNLFIEGIYQTDSEAYKPLGIKWELLGGAWGGRFKDSKGRPNPDGNHFSLEFNGIK
jgi:hypothetical protein